MSKPYRHHNTCFSQFWGHLLWWLLTCTKETLKKSKGQFESDCWKSLGQSGITIPSGECLGCRHCAAGQCKGSLGIFSGKPLTAKPRGLRPLGFAASGLPLENHSGALTLPLSTMSTPSTLSLGDSFSTLPLGFSTVAFKLPLGFFRSLYCPTFLRNFYVLANLDVHNYFFFFLIIPKTEEKFGKHW